ncbi:MAG: isoleucine--tRNA ligase [Planctomycetes bacterium]|nr:isoleucine--tRNA ligase [Planctomycetota bacterium]
MVPKVDTNPDFIALERQVLRLWEEEEVFRRRVEANRGGEPFRFLDGPITANNPMGVHHAWGRTLKDVFQRYHAMLGHDGRYQNGFDCQGLWVEVEVERDLGLDSKRDIEAYGLERFAEACRDRVRRFSAVQTAQSIRLGQWMDWDHSYYTYTDTNIEYIWRFLARCAERGWLYRGQSAMPWCTRCGTSLSQHEMADSYKELTHTAVHVTCEVAGTDDHFLVWTTTPWTLPANTALAVHPDLDYVRVRAGDRTLILGKEALDRLGVPGEVVSTVKGAALVGLAYVTPFDDLAVQKKVVHRVVAWKEVSAAEGTGIVHIAPGCGAEDFQLSLKLDLPRIVPIDEHGDYKAGYAQLSGRAAPGLTEELVGLLRERGRLHRAEPHTHRYPCCWRCGSELVFRLVEEWFIRCDEVRLLMRQAIQGVRWVPESVGKRMEDWLENMRDWCISRKRYWGLPLPFFVCPEGHMTGVESRADLLDKATRGAEGLRELHRPWIDAVRIRCGTCAQEAARIPEVGDCWLDAGIVPFSTQGWVEDPEHWRRWFPADFVCEMREQVRLWFYSLLFMSVTLDGRAPYRTVLCYEKVHDEEGRPMHKSAGNAIWFDQAVERMGADVMRWLYASWPIATNLRFGFRAGDEIRRKLLTLWNTYAFFCTYAAIDRPDLTRPAEGAALQPLDRWIRSRSHRLAAQARTHLEACDTPALCREAERFLDDLSNWYVRLTRRRFWRAGGDADKHAAYATLFECLDTAIRVLAPVVPFVTEAIHQGMVRGALPSAPRSVHLAAYPAPDPAALDPALEAEMEAVREVVTLGLKLRNDAQLKVRQPLAAVKVRGASDAVRLHAGLIAHELNVKRVEAVASLEDLARRTARLDFRAAGPRMGRRVQEVARWLESADADVLWSRREALAEVVPEGLPVPLPEELRFDSRPDPRYRVAEAGVLGVALDVALDPGLVAEGLARDLVRHVQVARKEEGLEVTDRIRLRVQVSDEALREALRRHEGFIADETLCDGFALVDGPLEGHEAPLGESRAVFRIERAP